LNRREAIDFLHNDKHYSRRLSAKLVDLAMDKSGGGSLQEALRKSLEGNLKKKEVKFRYVVKK
jgi:hypothetical protein